MSVAAGTEAMATDIPPPGRRTRRAQLLWTALEVGANFALPAIAYDQVKPAHGEIAGLLASSLPPLAWSLLEFLRSRRLDAMSVVALCGIGLSLLAFAGGGGVHALQLREKLVTGLIGLAFLVSAALRRPLVYQLARATEARRSPEALAALEARRDKPLFRRTMMTMTLAWGLGLVGEAALAATLVFILPTRTYLLVAPVLGYGVIGGLTLWTLWLRRRRMAMMATA